MSFDLVSNLTAPAAEVFRSLREEATQPGMDGKHYPVHQLTMLNDERATMLWRLARQIDARNTLETGFAFGMSTLMLLDVIGRHAEGRHTAIDPAQTVYYHGIGVRVAERCGMGERLRLVEEDSALAMPSLIRSREKFDLIMIDGNHLFAGVFMDTIFGAQLCREGGLLVFDDLWMASVQKLLRYVDHNMPWLRPIGLTQSGLAAYQCGKPFTQWFDFFADF